MHNPKAFILNFKVSNHKTTFLSLILQSDLIVKTLLDNQPLCGIIIKISLLYDCNPNKNKIF